MMSRCSAFALASLASNWRKVPLSRGSRDHVSYRMRTGSFSPTSRACHANADPIFPVSPYSAARLRRFRDFERARLSAGSAAGSRSGVSAGPSRIGPDTDSKDPLPTDSEQNGSPPCPGAADALDLNVEESAIAERIFDTHRAYESHDDYMSSILQMRGDPLEDFSDRIVLYRGSPCANLMIVGEAPGRDEELKGKPFVGKSGRLLDDIFTYAGFDMDRHVYITNVAKRRPPDNRNPTPEEIAFYMPLLLEEIRLVDPSMIILAGAIPLKALLNMTGITKFRGQWFSAELMGRVRMLMPIFHPSYLLRNATKKFDMKVDIDEIRTRYIEKYPEERLAEPRRTKPSRNRDAA